MAVFFPMFVTGILMGFIGAGGAGFIIAILTFIFNVPIHTALGTAIASMAFTTLSGAYSHYREGNIALKVGLTVGVFGAMGSFIGSKLAVFIPIQLLHGLTTGMLFLSSFLLFVRLFLINNSFYEKASEEKSTLFIVGKSALLGLVTGMLSGAFGIGSAPIIQIGLLILFGLSIRQSVGTTMLVILPIAIGGGVGYMSEGQLDFGLLFQVLIGSMFGAFIGAKFTGFAPKSILKGAMILTPAIAGIIMLI